MHWTGRYVQIMCSQSMSVLLSPSFSSSSSSSASVKFIIYLLILLTGVQLIDAFCADHQWFNGNECISCTRCDDSQFFVLRPCQKHTDTVCGTLDDVELELDWLKAAAIAAEHKQVSFLSIGFPCLHPDVKFLILSTSFSC